MNIGSVIKEKIERKNLSVADIAKRIGMTNQNLYQIFKKESIDTGVLKKISDVIDVPITDFFSDEKGKNFLDSQVAVGNGHIQTKNTGGSVEITPPGARELEIENRYLKEKVEELQRLIEEKERLIGVLMERR